MSEIRYTSGKEQFIDGLQSDVEILLKEVNRPSNTTGYGKVYAKNDGKLYYLDSNNNETQLGSSSGSNTDKVTDYFYSTVPTNIANTVNIAKLYCSSSDNTTNLGFDLSNQSKNDTAYQWLFNDGSGSTAAEVNNSTFNISISGSPNWNSGYLSLNGAIAANQFSTSTGTFSQLNTFSIALWVSFPTVVASRWFLNLANGAANAVGNYSFALGFDASNRFSCTLSNGSSSTNLIPNAVAPSNTKILLVFTYERVGVGTSVSSLSWTQDGSTWNSSSANNSVLIQQNTGFSIRSRLDTTGATGINTDYYRLAIYPNKILSTADLQTLWNAGSEGSVNSHITQTISNKGKTLNLSEKPYTLLFKENGSNRVSDEKGYMNSTLAGTYTWSTSGLTVSGLSNASNRFVFPAGQFNDSHSFSIATWVTFNTTPTTTSQYRGILVLGADNTADASNAVVLGVGPSSQPSIAIGAGGTLSGSAISGFTYTTGVKYLVVATYQRTGAGSVNPTNLYITSNGVDWYKANGLAPLMQINSSYAWRSNYPNTTNSCDVTYHRIEFYRNTILTSDDIQSLWDAGSDATYENVPDQFTFNEGTGTIVYDTKNLTNLTLSGTTSWNSDSLVVTGSTTGRILGSAGTFTGSQSFSIAGWVSLSVPTGANDKVFLAVGDGTGSTSGCSWAMETSTTGTALVSISNGTTLSTVNTTQTIPSNTKILYVLTYTHIGGANDNIVKVRWTSDGITWYENTNSSCVLIQSNVSFALRNNQAITPGTHDVTYYKLNIYQNKVLSNFEMQIIWDAGSESLVSPSNFGGINSVTLSNYLDGVISSSGTTVTGVGTNFSRDFLVGDILYTENMGRRITAIPSSTTLTLDSAFETNIPVRTLYQRGGYAPNTHFYTYVIGDGANTHLIATSRSTSVNSVLPSGYTKYKQLPLTVRAEFDCLPFRITGSWPNNFNVIYNIPFNTTATRTPISSAFTATTATLIDASKYISPLSTRPILYIYNSGTNTSMTVAPNTAESSGVIQISTIGSAMIPPTPAFCSSSQGISFRAGAAQNHFLSVYGYTITSEV